jgi:hypothetical protein
VCRCDSDGNYFVLFYFAAVMALLMLYMAVFVPTLHGCLFLECVFVYLFICSSVYCSGDSAADAVLCGVRAHAARAPVS